MDQETQDVGIRNGNFLRFGENGQRELEKEDTECDQLDARFYEIIPATVKDESEQRYAGDEKKPVDYRVQRHISTAYIIEGYACKNARAPNLSSTGSTYRDSARGNRGVCFD